MAKTNQFEANDPKDLRVLMVDDSEDDVLFTIRELKKGGYNPVYEQVETADAMKKALQEKQWDIILCDYKMPIFNAPSAIAVLKETNIDIPIIIISGAIGEETAVECMRLGAHDYFMKGKLSRLCPAIARELEETEVRNKQKQAEEALLKAAKEWQITFDATNDAIWILDQNNIVLHSNKTAERFFHRPLGELIGKKCWEIVHGTEQPIPECPILRVRKSLRRETTEIQEGECWFEINADPILDAAGQYSGAVHIVSNITERKKNEKDRRENEDRFRQISSMTSDIAYSCSTKEDGRFSIDWMIGATERISGYSIEEIKAQGCWRFLVLEEDLAIFDKNVIDLTPNLKGFCELRIRHKNGDIVWITSHTECFMATETSEHFILYGALVDITERKKVEKELQENEERFRLLADNSTDVIWKMTLEGKFTYISPSITNLCGYTPQEAMEIPFHKYVVDSYVEPVMTEISSQLQKPPSGRLKSLRSELQQYCKDGTIKDVEVTVGWLLDDRGNPIGIQGSTRDISSRKRAEKELQQTLDSLKKAFATNIQVMVSVVEVRDPYTAGHQLRVADLAHAIAGEMGLDPQKLDGIRMAGSIHDIGKLSVPAEILSKPTRLTNIEFSMIKEHSLSGYEMLKDVSSPWPLAQIVYQHHERIDGSGYPRNLKGKNIILEARIMAVADVVEAMASHRPYRPALGIDLALEEIEKNKGILYDNDVADACVRLFREKKYTFAK
jgi:PAS domain S-box-containing protein/putative nucleotidyltransferase with HDIG domain